MPAWPRVEMALASNCNTAISSVYYDFFQQREGVYNLVMGESLTTGVEGLLQIAMLKGMVRGLAHTIEKPTEFVQALNRRVVEEGSGQNFSFSLLSLFPSEERFSYISCGYSPLWHLPRSSETPRRLTADNLILGASDHPEVLEVDSTWHVGDTLILHTFQAGQAKSIEDIELDESQFLESLLENMFLQPKKQAEAIFRSVALETGPTLYERPVTVISIERTS